MSICAFRSQREQYLGDDDLNGSDQFNSDNHTFTNCKTCISNYQILKNEILGLKIDLGARKRAILVQKEEIANIKLEKDLIQKRNDAKDNELAELRELYTGLTVLYKRAKTLEIEHINEIDEVKAQLIEKENHNNMIQQQLVHTKKKLKDKEEEYKILYEKFDNYSTLNFNSDESSNSKIEEDKIDDSKSDTVRMDDLTSSPQSRRRTIPEADLEQKVLDTFSINEDNDPQKKLCLNLNDMNHLRMLDKMVNNVQFKVNSEFLILLNDDDPNVNSKFLMKIFFKCIPIKTNEL